MRYVVEARYIEGKPRLRILDADSGRACLEWSLVKTRKMLEEGEIKQEDFLNPAKYGMNLLIKNLFLLACADDLQQVNYPSCAGNLNSDVNYGWSFQYRIAPK